MIIWITWGWVLAAAYGLVLFSWTLIRARRAYISLERRRQNGRLKGTLRERLRWTTYGIAANLFSLYIGLSALVAPQSDSPPPDSVNDWFTIFVLVFILVGVNYIGTRSFIADRQAEKSGH